MRRQERINEAITQLLFKTKSVQFTAMAARHLTPTSPLWVESGWAEGHWLTLANVPLGEAPERAFHGDLLQVAVLHHLQAPGTGILLHDERHTAFI